MITIGSDAVLSVFVLFCRIGACLMLMPGISSPRIPVKVRLFLSFAITLGLAPLLSSEIGTDLSKAPPFALLQIIGAESVIGALIGFLGRVFFGALETLSNAIAMAIGLSSPLTPAPDENEPLPSVVSLISLGATMLFFFDGSALGGPTRPCRLLRGLAGLRPLQCAVRTRSSRRLSGPFIRTGSSNQQPLHRLFLDR